MEPMGNLPISEMFAMVVEKKFVDIGANFADRWVPDKIQALCGVVEVHETTHTPNSFSNLKKYYVSKDIF